MEDSLEEDNLVKKPECVDLKSTDIHHINVPLQLEEDLVK